MKISVEALRMVTIVVCIGSVAYIASDLYNVIKYKLSNTSRSSKIIPVLILTTISIGMGLLYFSAGTSGVPIKTEIDASVVVTVSGKLIAYTEKYEEDVIESIVVDGESNVSQDVEKVIKDLNKYTDILQEGVAASGKFEGDRLQYINKKFLIFEFVHDGEYGPITGMTKVE